MAVPSDERKPVTVLFADLVGSTELATRQNPEQLRAMLAAFFDEMREQIQAFGGSVEKYAGDAIMAVFGVPRVSEDDAERAVRAALAMRQSLEQLNPLFDAEPMRERPLRVSPDPSPLIALRECARRAAGRAASPVSPRPWSTIRRRAWSVREAPHR